jgi:hypothetical protein
MNTSQQTGQAPDDWDAGTGWHPVILGVPETSGQGDASRWSPEMPAVAGE